MLFSSIKKMLLSLALFSLLIPSTVYAHFGTIIPSRSMLDQFNRKAEISFSFIHPFEQKGMDMAKPEKVEIMLMGTSKIEDITNKLNSDKLLGHQAWKAQFSAKRPGVYCIYMKPEPYWEEAEDIYIKHLTKTYIAAYGKEDGWFKPVGLKTEIVPLTRPFGQYAGNVFQGQVYFNGKPAPYSEVEVEYYNKDKKAKAATEYMVTQVIRADENGIFSYAPPKEGWWGFAALNEADYTLKHNGKEKNVELGAVIWIKFLPWSE